MIQTKKTRTSIEINSRLQSLDLCFWSLYYIKF